MRSRAHPAAAAGLLLALTCTLTLSACSSAAAPRDRPNQVERAAVATAQAAAQSDGIAIPDDSWTQLWTPSQAATRIARCITRGSDGLLEFRVHGGVASSAGFSYTLTTKPKNVAVDGGIGPPFFDGQTVERVVDGCLAEYPADFRLAAVPPSDRHTLYAYDLTVLRRCILAHGQPVPAVPSRERFEKLMTSGTPWNAFELVRVTTRAKWYALSDACPALPPPIARDVTAAETAATTP